MAPVDSAEFEAVIERLEQQIQHLQQHLEKSSEEAAALREEVKTLRSALDRAQGGMAALTLVVSAAAALGGLVTFLGLKVSVGFG